MNAKTEQGRPALYLVVNIDLGMRPDKISSQTPHPAMNMLYDIMENRRDTAQYNLVKKYFADPARRIIVKRAHENVIKKLVGMGFYYTADAGFTDIPRGAITCVCLGILTNEEINSVPILKRLQNLQEEKL